MSTLVALPTMDQARRHKKMLRDGSGEVWPDHAEVLFSKAIQEYDRQTAIAAAHSPYPPDLPSRNEFIVRFLHDRGLDRSKQQVASHIQQLKKRSSKELPGSLPSSPSSGYHNHPYSTSDNHHPHHHNNNNHNHHHHHLLPPSTPIDQYYQAQQPQLPYAQPVLPSQTPSPLLSPQSPITAVAIRVNDAQPLQVPTHTLSRPSPSQYTTGAATLTGVSSSSTGMGMSIRIRLLVPPHQDALSHLSTSRIHAIVTLNPNYTIQTSTLGNKISVNSMFLLEETDNFLVQGNQLICPLRVSQQTSMMVGSQGSGFPVTIQQTVYGTSAALLKITYELVHAATATPPLHNSSAIYQYPANAGPFTQF